MPGQRTQKYNSHFHSTSLSRQLLLSHVCRLLIHFPSQVQCHHTIPAEIAEKVSEMILEGKQFCAYIVIPLHPEGDPAASATQEILAWQVCLLALAHLTKF